MFLKVVKYLAKSAVEIFPRSVRYLRKSCAAGGGGGENRFVVDDSFWYSWNLGFPTKLRVSRGPSTPPHRIVGQVSNGAEQVGGLPLDPCTIYSENNLSDVCCCK